MADRGADELVTWTLATFHAASLVAALVLLAHVAGSLGDLLGGLDTLVGLALFAVLWATTWWTNHRWLAGVRLRLDERPPTNALLHGGLVWGGTNGVAFFWGIFLLAVVPLFGFEVVSLAIIAVAGTVFAIVVGALFGVAFAAIDVGLVFLARRLAVDGAVAPGRL